MIIHTPNTSLEFSYFIEWSPMGHNFFKQAVELSKKLRTDVDVEKLYEKYVNDDSRRHEAANGAVNVIIGYGTRLFKGDNNVTLIHDASRIAVYSDKFEHVRLIKLPHGIVYVGGKSNTRIVDTVCILNRTYKPRGLETLAKTKVNSPVYRNLRVLFDLWFHQWPDDKKHKPYINAKRYERFGPFYTAARRGEFRTMKSRILLPLPKAKYIPAIEHIFEDKPLSAIIDEITDNLVTYFIACWYIAQQAALYYAVKNGKINLDTKEGQKQLRKTLGVNANTDFDTYRQLTELVIKAFNNASLWLGRLAD